MTPAERLLVGLGIAEPKDIDLDAIAWTQRAVVNYKPIDNCEATIVGSKRHAVISINCLSMRQRQRFSLGHELGHWHHHRGQVLFCGKNDVCNFKHDALNPERHADEFASDLILPNFMVLPRLRKMKRLYVIRVQRVGRGIRRQSHRHAGEDDGSEPLPHGHRLPQQARAGLVQGCADDCTVVATCPAIGRSNTSPSTCCSGVLPSRRFLERTRQTPGSTSRDAIGTWWRSSRSFCRTMRS